MDSFFYNKQKYSDNNCHNNQSMIDIPWRNNERATNNNYLNTNVQDLLNSKRPLFGEEIGELQMLQELLNDGMKYEEAIAYVKHKFNLENYDNDNRNELNKEFDFTDSFNDRELEYSNSNNEEDFEKGQMLSDEYLKFDEFLAKTNKPIDTDNNVICELFYNENSFERSESEKFDGRKSFDSNEPELNSRQEQQRTRKQRRSGASRKRYKKLLENGLSREAATRVMEMTSNGSSRAFYDMARREDEKNNRKELKPKKTVEDKLQENFDIIEETIKKKRFDLEKRQNELFKYSQKILQKPRRSPSRELRSEKLKSPEKHRAREKVSDITNADRRRINILLLKGYTYDSAVAEVCKGLKFAKKERVTRSDRRTRFGPRRDNQKLSQKRRAERPLRDEGDLLRVPSPESFAKTSRNGENPGRQRQNNISNSDRYDTTPRELDNTPLWKKALKGLLYPEDKHSKFNDKYAKEEQFEPDEKVRKDSSSTNPINVEIPQNSRKKEKRKNNIKVSIVPKNYPYEILDKSQLKILEKAILKEMDRIPVNGPQVRFVGTNFKPGSLEIFCADKPTRDWLSNKIKVLYPWDGAAFKCIEENNRSKLQSATVYVSGPGQPIEILRKLKRQNNELNTDEWKIYNTEKTKVGTLLFLGIDELSLTYLHKVNLKPFYGLGRLRFRLKRQASAEQSPGNSEGKPSDSPVPNSSERGTKNPFKYLSEEKKGYWKVDF